MVPRQVFAVSPHANEPSSGDSFGGSGVGDCTLTIDCPHNRGALALVEHYQHMADRLHTQMGLHVSSCDESLYGALLDGYCLAMGQVDAKVRDARDYGLLLHVGVVQ